MGDPITTTMAISLASTGLSAASKGVSAMGQSSADQFKAQQLDEAAQYGELKATQTNAQMTRNLTLTLSNIDAVRAAGHLDPTSPSGGAVREAVEEQGNTQKLTTVAGIQEQADMDEQGAAYMRQASSDALLGGAFSVGGTLLGGLGGAMKGGGFGGGSGGTGFSLTGTGGLY